MQHVGYAQVVEESTQVAIHVVSWLRTYSSLNKLYGLEYNHIFQPVRLGNMYAPQRLPFRAMYAVKRLSVGAVPGIQRLEVGKCAR